MIRCATHHGPYNGFLHRPDKLKFKIPGCDSIREYFSCPKCRQSVRVPKGKGKIAISCPKCREKFIKKT